MILFLFIIFLLLFKYNCLHFPPTTPPNPTLDTTPLWLCPCMFLYACSLTTLPPFASVIPSHLTTGYCQFVLYFNVSGNILLACFTNQVPLIGEIIWYLSLTTWLISLSIMLYSSIHAVEKGRSSLFLSDA